MEEIYYKLRDILAKLPQGFPSTETGIELKILHKLFNQEQAKIFIGIFESKNMWGFVDGSSKKLQKKLNMTKPEIDQKLDQMSKQGLLFRQRYKNDKNKPIYTIAPFIVGLYEFSVKTIDKELAQLCSEYLKHIASWQTSINTKLLRLIPVNNSIKDTKTVLPHNKIDELIKGHRVIALTPCICATESSLLEKNCKGPLERCISFDMLAKHYIDTGLGRQITQQEMETVLSKANDVGLIINASNTYPIYGFCLCCSCCCTAIKFLKTHPVPSDHASPTHHAMIDSEICSQCDICIDRCNMEAINSEGSYDVDPGRCIGCGLCVTKCPTGAIQLFDKKTKHEMPSEWPAELYMKMAEEHIKKGHLDKKELPKIKFAKSFIGVNKYIKKIKRKVKPGE